MTSQCTHAAAPWRGSPAAESAGLGKDPFVSRMQKFAGTPGKDGEPHRYHTSLDPSSAGRSRSSPEFDTVPSRGRVPAASVTITTRTRGTRQNRVEPRPGPRTMAEESPSSEEPRRHRGVSARGRELLDRGAPSSSSQRPVPFISLACVPKPSQPYIHNTIDTNMPAAAFVAGAAIQEANQAAHIAHHAASMAEQQAIEAMRARQ